MKKLAIFDLDGTLLNSLTDLADACNYALQSAGFPLHPEEAYKLFVGDGLQKLIERAMPPGDWDAGTFERVFCKFNEYYDIHGNDNTRPYPGVWEMLEELRNHGVMRAVLTNKPHEYAVSLVESIFPGLVDLTYGHREGIPLKPDPSAVLEILDCLGVRKEMCAYIGDTSVDMWTGLAAGLNTVGVTWGYRTKQELESSGAHVIVHKVEDLIPILVDK